MVIKDDIIREVIPNGKEKCDSHTCVISRICDMSHLFSWFGEFQVVYFSIDGPSAYTQQASGFGLVPVGLV